MNVTLSTSRPVIYFETHGNKKRTIADIIRLDVLKEKIYTMFKPGIEKYIITDHCISCSLGEGTVNVPNEKYYQDLGLKPNYNPYFTDTVNNYYASTIFTKTGQFNKIGEKFQSYNLNLYLTSKYSTDFDKSNHFSYLLSMNFMLISLFD